LTTGGSKSTRGTGHGNIARAGALDNAVRYSAADADAITGTAGCPRAHDGEKAVYRGERTGANDDAIATATAVTGADTVDRESTRAGGTQSGIVNIYAN